MKTKKEINEYKNKYQREYRKKNPKYRNYQKIYLQKYFLKKLYNLELDEYNEILTQQLSGCSICNKPMQEIGQYLCVDHNHNTGKVRSLLCKSCNLIIGNSNENPEILRRAADYLENFL